MLVGRPSERRVIGELIAAARLGRGGVLILTGEPGVGKTALLADAAQTLTGMRTLQAVGTAGDVLTDRAPASEPALRCLESPAREP